MDPLSFVDNLLFGASPKQGQKKAGGQQGTTINLASQTGGTASAVQKLATQNKAIGYNSQGQPINAFGNVLPAGTPVAGSTTPPTWAPGQPGAYNPYAPPPQPYGAYNPYGAYGAYGAQQPGVPVGVNAYGQTIDAYGNVLGGGYGASPYGAYSPYGSPYAASPYGAPPYAASPYPSASPYGASPYPAYTGWGTGEAAQTGLAPGEYVDQYGNAQIPYT